MKQAPDRRRSVRQRLLQWLVLPIAAALIAGTTAEIYSSADPIRQAYDRAMADAALALGLNVEVSADGRIDAHVTQEVLNILRTDVSDDVFYQIQAPDGSLLAGDADLPRVTISGENPAFQTVLFRGRRVRLMTYDSSSRSGAVRITIAKTSNKSEFLRRRIWKTALWANGLELLAILAFVWFAVRAALKPVGAVAEQIATRSPGDLSPLAENKVPLELQGVIRKLNSLLATIEASRRAEHEFLDNAAHQLRTPLAGLLAQLDLLVADEPDAARHARLCLIQESARRLSRTAQQLLALSRSGHHGFQFADPETVDLAAIAETVVSNQVQRAATQGVDLGAELEAAQASGVPWLLAEALGNLLDNALAYTPRGGMVTVRTGMREGRAFVEVVDTGIGIPAEERQKVLSRFYRGKQSRGSGSGLGLSIVAEVAQQHNAVLSIRSGEGGRGTRVRIDFPPSVARSLNV